MEIKELIMEFSKTRPESNIIIGYGSKIKRQANDKGIQKQIDLILGVEDSIKWHKLNYEMNPSDYKSKIGYGLLPIYEKLGTKINYLSYLPFEGHMFKIGLVENNDLLEDLVDWNNFFLAGRFQKPIEIIKDTDTLHLANRINRMNALKTALLACGKERISERELYETLCSLSFVGDWRQLLQIETKNKVKNIVEGSFDELHNIYSEFNDGFYEKTGNDELIINYENLLNKIDTLPENLRVEIINRLFSQMTSKSFDNKILEIMKKTIINHFTRMNLKTSAAQPIKGIILNGPSKSLTYLNQKLAKK